MRKVLFVCLLLNIPSLQAVEQIKLSEAQLDNLGVQLGHPQEIDSIPLMEAPAQVSIPHHNEYVVSSFQAGLVQKINVAIGDEVKKGQILVSIKSPELLALQLQHLQTLNELRLVRSQYTRDKNLHQEGVIAAKRWLKTQTDYSVLSSRVNETRQLLSIAGLSDQEIKLLEKKHQLSSQLKLVSPITGTVLQCNVIPGERVDALVPLFRVANLDELWLDISIPQERLKQIHVGDTVYVKGQDATATVFLLAENVNTRNQTVLVRAKIVSGLESLRPGQTVNTQIRQFNNNAKLKVFNSALATHQGKTYIFVKNKDGFNALPVTVLGSEKQTAIISGDVRADDTIAVKGAVALKAAMLGLGGDE